MICRWPSCKIIAHRESRLGFEFKGRFPLRRAVVSLNGKTKRKWNESLLIWSAYAEILHHAGVIRSKKPGDAYDSFPSSRGLLADLSNETSQLSESKR